MVGTSSKTKSMRTPRASDYEECPLEAVPDGLKWKPAPWAGAGAARGPREHLPPSKWPWVNKRREWIRKRRKATASPKVTMFSTPGSYYMLVRELNTGVVTYFKRKGAEPAMTPKDKIDAEPTRGHQVRYRKGAMCWFIGDASRWFLCTVVERGPKSITITPVTGWDAERVVRWPHPNPLKFSSNATNDGDLFRRLRPLKDRYL